MISFVSRPLAQDAPARAKSEEGLNVALVIEMRTACSRIGTQERQMGISDIIPASQALPISKGPHLYWSLRFHLQERFHPRWRKPNIVLFREWGESQEY